MAGRFSLGKKIAAGYIVALLMLGAVGLTSYWSMAKLVENAQGVTHTLEVLQTLEHILSLVKDIETGARGFVITGSERYLEPYDVAIGDIEDEVQTLRQLTTDNFYQQRRLEHLEQLIAEKLARAENLIQIRKDSTIKAVSQMSLLERSTETMNEIRKSISEMKDEEHAFLKQRDAKMKISARRMTEIIIGVGLLTLLLVGLAGIATGRDIIGRKRAEEQLEDSHKKLAGWVTQLEREARERNLLSELGDLLQTCLTTEEAYSVIAKRMSDFFPSTSGAVCLVNPSRHDVEAMASWGASAASQPMFQIDACWGLRRGRMHVVHDSDASPICRHLDASLFSPYLCLPMTAQGEMMGLLHIQRLPSETGAVSGIFPSESQQRLAVIIGEHISLALANLRLREALRAQSIRDPLTGLFNRRYMEESLDRELPRASREKTSLGVVLIDLDHFKQFNDTFGHAAGDTLLARVGLFLRNQIRSEDIACRYGGEEFILILPGSSLEATRARAERIRQHLRQMSIGYEGQTLGTITLSAGVAAFPHDGSNAKAVLRAADDALYHAKSKGRDRVMIAQDVKQLPQTEPSSFRVC